MPTINSIQDIVVRGRYRLAAIVFLVLSFVVIWLTRLPGMAAAVPKPFAAEWRLPLAVAGVLVATGVVWTAHRKLTLLVSLFPLYRLVVLLSDLIAADGKGVSGT
jgi:hypothetical protein